MLYTLKRHHIGNIHKSPPNKNTIILPIAEALATINPLAENTYIVMFI